ncbi:MAG: TauD/TfdA family dioxygenase [Nevskia sp.]|nr:TauD/TfdA family dioxygenase [Nevskia sp.]
MYKSLRAQTLHYLARPHVGMRIEPLSSPAAWRGAEARTRTEWQVRLAGTEVAELRAAVAAAQATGKPLGQLTRPDFPLPGLAARIGEWRNEIRHGRGFVLIRGVPVEEWSTAQCEVFFWCLGQHLGIPGAQNPEGDLLGHVRDQRGSGDARYYRTNKALAVHCDAADAVGLMCLRPARSGGLSQITSSVAVYNELLRRAPALVSRLYRPFYFDTKGEGGVRAFPIAPCRYADGELRTFWQSDYFRSVRGVPWAPPLSAEEHRLLDLYDEIANSDEFRLDMDLQPGDVQLISNHTILHARSGFTDWPEPERQRHLLRLWISLPASRGGRSRWLARAALARLLATAAREMLHTALQTH